MIQAIFRLNWPSGFEGDFESWQVYEVLNWPSGFEEVLKVGKLMNGRQMSSDGNSPH